MRIASRWPPTPEGQCPAEAEGIGMKKKTAGAASTRTRNGPGNGRLRPDVDEVPRYTDAYFLKSKQVVGRFGDVTATYAVFMRRPVIYTGRPTVEWLRHVAELRQVTFDIDERHQEGDWVGAGDPLLYVTGPPVSRPITPTAWARNCRRWRSWPWMRAIAPVSTWPS